MQYMMKSGILFDANEKKIAQIKGTFGRVMKTIFLSDSSMQYQADIDIIDVPGKKNADIHNRVYVLKNDRGEVLMEAHPGYAKDDDPDKVGWPICRAPKVDHAEVRTADNIYILVMHNSQNYALQSKNGTPVLQIMHKGISGGWTIDTTENFCAEVICGLFIFCRYIEQENEFLIV